MTTNPVLPRIAVGTMNFGKRTNESDSSRIVSRALELGLSHFDTANAYNDGRSEVLLGQALRGVRSDCVVASKVGFARVDNQPEGLSKTAVLRGIEGSLRRLNTDYLDIYYLHVPDHRVPIEETLEAVLQLLEERKIRSWGVSNYASWQILEMVTLADRMGLPRPFIGQQLYNLLIRELDIEYFAFAKKYQIHTTVYNPLAGGLLAGGHRLGEPIRSGSRFDKNPFYQRRYWTQPMFERAAAYGELAATFGLSPVTLAYAFVFAHPGVDSVLVGPASVEQLDAAWNASRVTPNASMMHQIHAIHAEQLGTDTHYVR